MDLARIFESAKKIDDIESRGLAQWLSVRTQLLLAVDAYAAQEDRHNREFVDAGVEKRAQVLLETRHLLANFDNAVQFGVPATLKSLPEMTLRRPLHVHKAAQLRDSTTNLVVEMDNHTKSHDDIVRKLEMYEKIVRICTAESQTAGDKWTTDVDHAFAQLDEISLSFKIGCMRAQTLLAEIGATRDALAAQYAVWGHTPEQVCAQARQQLRDVYDAIALTKQAISAVDEI